MMSKNKDRVQLRLSRIASFLAVHLALLSGTMMNAQAREYFDPALLELGTPGQNTIDLSSFEEKGGQLPGTYRVDIYINNQKMDTRDVEFRQDKDEKGEDVLRPCLPVDDLANWGVIAKKFPTIGKPGSACANLEAVPQASSDFRFSRQQLLLSFPQSAMNGSARGWVDPKMWDEGIPVALLNYNMSGSSSKAKSGRGSDSNNQYINLRPGINIGPWRLRNYTTWNRSDSSAPDSKTHDKWETVYTYAQRDIIALKGQLTAGDSSTAAEVFDSIAFRGIQLASDDEMLPDSLRGYAPVVRGIARTNAQVTIRQNGYIIYQTYVSPGSFEIDDMFPTGGSGDLYVTIKESDGSEQQLVVPFASLPVLQREGRLKYAVTTGLYRSYDHSVDETPLSEGTIIYGLPSGFTAYGGGQFSSNYQALALGVGKNLGDLGALSTDVTQAWSKLKFSDKEDGQSWRVRYSKNFVKTGTNFAVAGYRYATSGYWNMQEVLNTYTDGNSYPLQERRRNRAEITLSQNLGNNFGNLGLSAAQEDYWNTDRRMSSYSASYNNSMGGVSYGLSYTYSSNSAANYTTNGNRGRTYDKDQLFAFNLSVPLNVLFGNKHPTYATYSASTSKNGNTTNNVSLNGTMLDDNNLSWGVQQGYGSQGQGNNGSINTNWRATYGEVNGGYAYDKDSQRLNYGIQGGILAHENGVTLGQQLGETVILVEAPGAKNVVVQGHTGVKTDWRGYAVVPYASPYRKNDVALNTQTFGDDIEVAITNQTVIPTRGAVVRASYQTSIGHRVLMNLTQPNGKPVPFGAMVSLLKSKNAESSIVGDNGQAYLTGLPDSGALLVKWGREQSEQCTVSYSVPGDSSGVTNMNELCR